MTRENSFWHHYVAQHAGHSVLTFSTTAAIGALLCLFLLACWATGQVMTRCANCAAVPSQCRCARARARRRD